MNGVTVALLLAAILWGCSFGFALTVEGPLMAASLYWAVAAGFGVVGASAQFLAKYQTFYQLVGLSGFGLFAVSGFIAMCVRYFANAKA